MPRAAAASETGTQCTLTPVDPTTDDGRYYGEISHRGRVFEFARGALVEVFETTRGEVAFRCQRLGEERIFFGDELVDHRGRSTDSLIGHTRPGRPDDEVVEPPGPTERRCRCQAN